MSRWKRYGLLLISIIMDIVILSSEIFEKSGRIFQICMIGFVVLTNMFILIGGDNNGKTSKSN